jgi:hypothetical protein
MSVRRDKHVPLERLTALAFVCGAPEGEADQQAFEHLSICPQCASAFERMVADADALRDTAREDADAVFTDAVLDVQRTRILDRLLYIGQSARVLPFPIKPREVAMPVSTSSRRWVSVAAAAGLIIGLVAGQMLHVASWGLSSSRAAAVGQAPAPQSVSSMGPASDTTSFPTDDEFLDELEAVVQLRRAHFLRALDALTPTAGDFRDLPRGR